MISTTHHSPHVTKRERLALMCEAYREVIRVTGRQADQRIEDAVIAANGLHLRTALRHAREAWRLVRECYGAAVLERELERELAAMEAS